jgi:hypothetical protein
MDFAPFWTVRFGGDKKLIFAGREIFIHDWASVSVGYELNLYEIVGKCFTMPCV